MKKSLILLAAPIVLFLGSCGGTKKKEPTTDLPGSIEIEFKINGNLLSMMVLDSINGKLEIVEQPWGATEIKVGKYFQISIEEGAGDVALMKSDIAGNEINKFKRYIKDEPTLLFWESEITAPEFHFYSVVKPGEVSYVVKDIAGDIFDEKSTSYMVESSKTLKVKEAEKPNS